MMMDKLLGKKTGNSAGGKAGGGAGKNADKPNLGAVAPKSKAASGATKKKKRKTLPKDFQELLEVGGIDVLKARRGQCRARSSVSLGGSRTRSTATAARIGTLTIARCSTRSRKDELQTLTTST